MQIKDSMTLLSSNETRITERNIFLIELKLSFTPTHNEKHLNMLRQAVTPTQKPQ